MAEENVHIIYIVTQFSVFPRMAAENFCPRLEIWQKFSADFWRKCVHIYITDFAVFSRMAAENFCPRLEIRQKFSADFWRKCVHIYSLKFCSIFLDVAENSAQDKNFGSKLLHLEWQIWQEFQSLVRDCTEIFLCFAKNLTEFSANHHRKFLL